MNKKSPSVMEAFKMEILRAENLLLFAACELLETFDKEDNAGAPVTQITAKLEHDGLKYEVTGEYEEYNVLRSLAVKGIENDFFIKIKYEN